MGGWTLHIEHFGKIKKADVSISPFTMFIGDNNSGKSYLMTLIYGLMNLGSMPFHNFPVNQANEGSVVECGELLNRLLFRAEKDWAEGRPTESESGHKEFQVLERCFNQILDHGKEVLTEYFFNRRVPIGKLSITFDQGSELKVRFLKEKTGFKTEARSMTAEFFVTESKNSQVIPLFTTTVDGDGKFTGNVFYAVWLFFLALMRRDFAGNREEALYLPTSRSGFLLTYKALTGQALGRMFNNLEMGEMGGIYEAGARESRSKDHLLTRPASDFLQRLSSISEDHRQQKYDPITEFIEGQVLGGRIGMSRMPSPDFYYIPDGGKEGLPMYVSSGVVTELTPLVLFLRYSKVGALLMEEPEMCLHPELQWKLARALIRLSNTGMPVLIATHSDTILQHVNNMIKLSGREKEKIMDQYEYVQADLLLPEQIGVYQFVVNEESGQTKVEALSCNKSGFYAPTFLNTLGALLRETRDFDSEA